MKAILKKTILSAAGGSLVLSLVFPAMVLASSAPKLSISSNNDTSAVLKISATSLKKKSVKIKVRIENKDTDTVETKIYSKTLDKKGEGKISVTGLSKGAEYSFQAAIRKTSETDYSDYSGAASLNKIGAKSYSAKLSLKDSSKTSIKLKFTSSSLKKKKAKIKVRIYNNDTNKVETRMFSQTLDKSGNYTINLTGLSADTSYSIKAAVKKSSDSGYSSFSNQVTKKTDG
ncbi:MAG: hypothetical protein HGB08_04815 [Candidatus Moranbacteria bacterium]|nr:hypothetical protein [Candidatus Moranbacteria bacterium]